MRTQLMGDIMIEDLEYLEVRMPEIIQRDRSVPETDHDTMPVVRRNEKPMEEDVESSKILPEATTSKKQETSKSETQIKEPQTKKIKEA